MTGGPISRLRAEMHPARKSQASQPPPAPPKTPESAGMDLFIDGELVAAPESYADALRAAESDPSGLVWMRLTEATAQTLEEIAATFGLHPLAVEDAVHGDQRPKLEEFGETSFMVLKTARYVEHERLTATSEVVDTGELMLFIGRHFVVSVVRGPSCDFDQIRRRLQGQTGLLPGLLREHGPWALVHAIVDTIVDEYLAVLVEVSSDIDRVEESIFATRRSGDVQRIYKLNREVMELRRAVAPLSRPLALLASSAPEAGAPDVPLELRPAFRDVLDHQARVVDQLNSYGQLLDSVISASLAEIGIRQNDDMRRISAWVALAAVPTMIAGIYGMNFDHMPELRWTFGYPLVLALMATICGLLYRAFRRSGWL